MKNLSIPIGQDRIPIYPSGAITDRIDHDDTVCFVCSLTRPDSRGTYDSYEAWARRHNWSIVDRDVVEPEWTLLISKNKVLVNLSMKHLPDPHLLITVVDQT